MSRFESPNHLDIRPLEPEDLPQLEAFRQEAWQEPLMTPEEVARRIDKLREVTGREDRKTFIGTLDNEIVGALSYYHDVVDLNKDPELEAAYERLVANPPSLGKTATFGHIFELAVHPDVRGNGYARQLALAGLRTLRGDGITLSKFHIGKHNQGRFATPETLQEFGATTVRSGIRGIGEHSDLRRTLYIGKIDPSIDALERRANAE